MDLNCSNGPVSSMPGSSHSFPPGTKCDDHPEVDAVKRVQGETDSFGCEYILMCQVCVDAFAKYRETEDTSGQCGWCKEHAERRLKRRDYDEGMGGPVYDVCIPCITKDNERAREELDEMKDDWHD